MSKPSPTPPRETSAAQTGTSVSTSIANAFLNNPNEVTRDGTRTTDQTGSHTWTDPYTGQTYTVPRFTVTQTLSDQQEAIADQNDAASLNLATLGNNLSGSLGQQLTGNFRLGNEAVEGRLFDLGMNRLNPRFDQDSESLRSRLANQGIKAGSEAYDREMTNMRQGQNDAVNQLLLTGRGQASQELLTEDNQRINQISALLSGGQVSQPNFMTAGYTGQNIPVTNNAQIIGQYDQQRAANAAAMNGSIGSAIGGLGGLFSGGTTPWWISSDKRLKKDIKEVGKINGHKVYSYHYKAGGPMQLGLMAQDVEKKVPEAVKTDGSGFKMVNYAKALQLGA